jgi:hypothetical protein
MTVETAQQLTAVALRMIGELDSLINVIQVGEPEDEFKQLRRNIAPLYADIQERLLDQPFREHPWVAPDWWPGRKTP